jgi:uncharacterized delta-60 repeat protein
MKLPVAGRALIAAILVLAFTTSVAAAAPSSPDPSYGTGGTTIVPGVSVADPSVRVVALPSGKLLVAFPKADIPTNSLLVVRLNPDGSLDSTFGSGGIANFGSSAAFNAIEVAPSGRIYVQGDKVVAGKNHTAIWALTASGQPDTGWNATGEVVLGITGDAGTENFASGIGVQPDGNVVSIASGVLSAHSYVICIRLNSTGAVQTNTGKSKSGQDLVPTAAKVLADGSVAYAANYTTGGLTLTVTGKFTSAGAPDASYSFLFAPDFAIFGYPYNGSGYVDTLGADTAGHIVGTGQTFLTGTLGVSDANTGTPGLPAYGAVRWLPAGSFTSSFSGFANGAGNRWLTTADVRDATAAPSPTTVVRFNPDGSLDSSFAANGATSFGPVVSSSDIAVGTDKKYYVAHSTATTVQVTRLYGDAPEPGPPVIPASAAFSKSIKSKTKASKFKSFSGTAAGTGLTKVEVAIGLKDSKLLKKSKKCAFVKSSSGSTKNYKAVKGKCVPGRWLKATGTTSWKYKLKKTLKRGSYTLYVRAFGTAGVSPVKKKSIKLN